MPGYISEFKYYGDTSQEFVEIALPLGTDPSGYSIAHYMSNGQQIGSFGLGTVEGTMSGHDVYVIDASTPGFANSDEVGAFYPDDAIALIDNNGNVVQFLSWEGNTVTATDGPAAGATSTNTGNITAVGQSMQSNDGGNTYFAQSNTNSGTIPACYAPGTLILTTTGLKRVEDLRVGNAVLCRNNKPNIIRWIWSGTQPLEAVALHEKPVLIRKGALGDGLPKQDMTVSGQHRIVAGIGGQLEAAFPTPCLVPAKALTMLSGIRFMAGKSAMVWYHFLCDVHCVITANGTLSETLLLGPEIIQSLSQDHARSLSLAFGQQVTPSTQQTPALPCLTVQETRLKLQVLRKGNGPKTKGDIKAQIAVKTADQRCPAA
ncbi:Hint domain-containing protein [Litoreibacter sp.]|nr:Hint domain-containing protein [Litoreibacter sp.]